MRLNYKKIVELLLQSFREAFKWKFYKWLITGGLGSFVAFLTLGKSFFELPVRTSFIYGLAALVALYVVRLLLIFIVKSMKYFHEVYVESIYGEAIILLKDSFAQTHAYRKIPGHQDREFMNTMLTFCANLKSIFDLITKSNCCVSIKVPLEDEIVNEKTVLMNLTRDPQHSNRDTIKYSTTKHTIIGNTAFSQTFNKVIQGQKQKYYVNNDVNNTVNYENTSKACHESGKLPYDSELVHPITPIISHDSNNFDCHGFICVDSDKKNAFLSKYGIAILEGVADGLYDMISQRNSNKTSANV